MEERRGEKEKMEGDVIDGSSVVDERGQEMWRKVEKGIGYPPFFLPTYLPILPLILSSTFFIGLDFSPHLFSSLISSLLSVLFSSLFFPSSQSLYVKLQGMIME